jgi:catechol 2,3-dioxygenase-like lactoylglutathione lyase family enzyme
MHTEAMIAVRDVPASAAWYRRLLGCRTDHGRPDFDRLIDPDGGGVLLMLHQLQGEEHGLTAPVPGAAGSGVLLWFYVDDLDAAFERAGKLAAPVVVPPHDNPQTGWRELTIRDPDGYHLALVQI